MSETLEKPVAYKSPLHEMTQTTPTCLWNDSATLSELTYSIEHGGVGADRLLHLDAGDVLSAGDDDVLAAIAQLDVAVGMPHGKVT